MSNLALYQSVNNSNQQQLSRIYNFCNNDSSSRDMIFNCIYSINKNKDNNKYFNTTNINDPSNFGISVWQGIAKYKNGLLLFSGTSKPSVTTGQGIVYIGNIECKGGTIYEISVPSAEYTSLYGPRYDTTTDLFTLVGSYMLPNDSYTYGFLYRGSLTDFTNPSNYVLQMNYSEPACTTSFTHSTDGDFAVGNSGSPGYTTTSWLYNITNNTYTAIQYPGAKTTTTYGIVKNPNNSYTIVGGYSPSKIVSINDIYLSNGIIKPIENGYVADFTYDGSTITFKNWTSIQYQNNLITHFEGVSSTNNQNVYTISADSLGINNVYIGLFLIIERSNGTFTPSNWKINDYGSSIGQQGVTSSNSVVDNKLVGVFASLNGSTQAVQTIII